MLPSGLELRIAFGLEGPGTTPSVERYECRDADGFVEGDELIKLVRVTTRDGECIGRSAPKRRVVAQHALVEHAHRELFDSVGVGSGQRRAKGDAVGFEDAEGDRHDDCTCTPCFGASSNRHASAVGGDPRDIDVVLNGQRFRQKLRNTYIAIIDKQVTAAVGIDTLVVVVERQELCFDGIVVVDKLGQHTFDTPLLAAL